MEELLDLLGDELYQKVTQKLVDKKLIIDDGKLIPKHRFDCVNMCLKETKQSLTEKTALLEYEQNRVVYLDKALLESKIDTALVLHKARNLTAVKSLIDFSSLKLEQDGGVSGLEDQVLQIKRNQNFLFEKEENSAFVLIPVQNGDSLNKSIMNYINKLERKK